MNLDSILKSFPLVGVFFERTYAFWQQHIALANITHIVLGFGLALFIFTRHKLWGGILLLAAAVMHIIAFSG